MLSLISPSRHQQCINRPAVGNPAIASNLPRPAGLQVTHFYHALSEGVKKCPLVFAEKGYIFLCFRECVKCLIRIKKPSPSNQVLENICYQI
ncbi:hypothetical protein OIU78_020952 [Salix suchowensis]|nr:hypothetical protein OIU78_020952 [Salix suchowensis]